MSVLQQRLPPGVQSGNSPIWMKVGKRRRARVTAGAGKALECEGGALRLAAAAAVPTMLARLPSSMSACCVAKAAAFGPCTTAMYNSHRYRLGCVGRTAPSAGCASSRGCGAPWPQQNLAALPSPKDCSLPARSPTATAHTSSKPCTPIQTVHTRTHTHARARAGARAHTGTCSAPCQHAAAPQHDARAAPHARTCVAHAVLDVRHTRIGTVRAMHV